MKAAGVSGAERILVLFAPSGEAERYEDEEIDVLSAEPLGLVRPGYGIGLAILVELDTNKVSFSLGQLREEHNFD